MIAAAHDGIAASHPNAKYSAPPTRTVPTRIIGAKTIYARSSCSADQLGKNHYLKKYMIPNLSAASA